MDCAVHEFWKKASDGVHGPTVLDDGCFKDRMVHNVIASPRKPIYTQYMHKIMYTHVSLFMHVSLHGPHGSYILQESP